jgi:predicted RNA-binding Zn-ribbon protein involved in translation (DUF1610 family)
LFDDLTRELRNLNGELSVEISLPLDEKGYLERECPSENCLFRFRVLGSAWESLPGDATVTCPMCGCEASVDRWWTKEQVEYAEKRGGAEAERLVERALRRGTDGFNRSQPKGGFVTMSMSVDGSPQPLVLPLKAGEALQLDIECEACDARFAVVGAAFFCPLCGHNSAARTFDGALRKVQAKLDSTEAVRAAVSSELDPDAAELVVRSLIETGVQDCVVAFQRLCEVLYGEIPDVASPRRNAFQNIDEGSRLWEEAIGKGYEDWLDSQQLEEARLMFQRRHLLAHREGIVDQDYLDRTSDSDYVIGQRIVVAPEDVRRLAELVGALADGLRKSLASGT